jgi:hypothetical protein
VARVDDIALVEMPTGETGRGKSMHFIELKNFDAIDRKEFKLEPQRMLSALRWLHNGSPPDFESTLLGESQRWFAGAANLLLEELKRHDPRCARRSPRLADALESRGWGPGILAAARISGFRNRGLEESRNRRIEESTNTRIRLTRPASARACPCVGTPTPRRALTGAGRTVRSARRPAPGSRARRFERAHHATSLDIMALSARAKVVGGRCSLARG